MIRIDNFEEEDFPELCDLMKHWGEDESFSEEIMRTSLSNIINNDGNRILIAKEGNAIAGYAQTCRCVHLGFEPFIEVIQLLVAEDRRSSGVGRLLMKRIEDDAIEENIHIIKLSSQVHRSHAHVFYERLGYSYYKISKFYEKKMG